MADEFRGKPVRAGRRWTNGATHLVFDPVELLERLAALTPRPRINLVLCHGGLAPRAAWRQAVVPSRVIDRAKANGATAAAASGEGVGGPPAGRPLNRTWAN